jgi:16S rRNA (uracil1498-N3)-methyltransferase
VSNTRLYYDAAITAGASLQLGTEQARYVGRVLRAKPGQQVSVFNGDDGEWLAEIESIGKNDATLHIISSTSVATESPLDIHLVQGVSRGERMDFVMQKATELGVKRISPVLSDHGMVRLDGNRAIKRQGHWQSIANSACEQCGRIRPPLVDAPIRLNDWFGRGPAKTATQLILRPDSGKPLASFAAAEKSLCLLVGPEGGFSAREYEDAEVAGFSPVSLGPRILRTETAAVAVLTLAQSLWGDLQA